MDYVISNYNCTTSELKAINRVRLHHKCYTLAHVSSGKGTQFLHLSPSFSSSILPSITFPKTFPTSKDYTIWNSIFSRLPSPSLGPWKITNSSLVTCLYDPHQQHVYIKKSNTWIQYQQCSNYSTRSYSKFTIYIGPIPFPTSLQIGTYTPSKGIDSIIYFHGSAHNILPPTNPITIESTLSSWGNSWPWNYIQVDDDASWLPDAIKDGITVVSDGSYQPLLSTTRSGSAWIIESNTTQQKIIGYLPTTTTNGGSYRSELTGIYAALTYLLATTQVHNITKGTVTVHCDNEKAILLSSITGSRLPLKTSHADILRLIRATVTRLPTNTKFQHIYGHQDK